MAKHWKIFFLNIIYSQILNCNDHINHSFEILIFNWFSFLQVTFLVKNICLITYYIYICLKLKFLQKIKHFKFSSILFLLIFKKNPNIQMKYFFQLLILNKLFRKEYLFHEKLSIWQIFFKRSNFLNFKEF